MKPIVCYQNFGRIFLRGIVMNYNATITTLISANSKDTGGDGSLQARGSRTQVKFPVMAMQAKQTAIYG